MVDVESIIDPLRQIVPTLLDVPYTTDEVAAPRSTPEEEDRLVTTSLQDLSKSPADLHDEPTPSSAEAQENVNVDSVIAESLDSLTVESVDQLKSSADPGQSILSVPDVTSDSETDTHDDVAELLESDQT